METRNILGFDGPIEVIHNFYEPGLPSRSVEEIRSELGLGDEIMILHSSNLRPAKRIDLLLETIARVRTAKPFKLVILAGGSFATFASEVSRLKIEDRVIVRENILDIENYLQAADLGLYTSESESFGVSILETMFFGRPCVATQIGGIPEVIENGVSGLLVPFGDADQLARAVEKLIEDTNFRVLLGQTAQAQARQKFSTDAIIPRYETLYRKQLTNKYNVV